jgi:hypothetical protein
MDQPIGWAKAVWLWNQATAWARALWHSLPPKAQGAAVIFAAGAGASLGKLLSDPTPCWQKGCLQHYAGAAIGAGVVALRAFYMRPGPGPHAGEGTHTGS